MKIIENIISVGHGSINPSYLFIHETADPGATASDLVSYWKRNPSYIVHYVCDWTGTVYHCMQDSRKAWQVGYGNGYGVGMEICHATSKENFEKAWGTAVEFAACYLKEKGWDISHIMSHHEAAKKWGGSDHTDPDGYFESFGRSWSEFKNEVSAKLNGTNTTTSTATTATADAAAKTTTSKITVDGYWGRDTTTKAQQVFKTPVDGIVSGQYKGNCKYLRACLSGVWEFSAHPTGSALIKAIQRWAGATVDGIAGKETVKSMQKKLGEIGRAHV